MENWTEFVKIKQIGQGGYGSVFLISKDGVHYAMKEAGKGKDKELIDEYQFIRSSDIEYTPKIFYQGTSKNGNTMFIMEYLPYSLKQLMNKKMLFDSDRALVAHCLIRALLTIHSRGFIHKDIKPDNILFTESFLPRIVDFGLVSCTRTEHRNIKHGITPAYAPPEALFSDDYPIDSTYDVFCYGLLIYDLYFGLPRVDNIVFLEESMFKDYINGLREGCPNNKYEIPYLIFMECTEFDPKRRQKLEEVYYYVEKLLNNDIRSRIHAESFYEGANTIGEDTISIYSKASVFSTLYLLQKAKPGSESLLLQRFKFIRSLENPHIARPLGCFYKDKTVCVLSEFPHHQISLNRMLKLEKVNSLLIIFRVFHEIHAKNIVYRYLSPDHLFLDNKNILKLLWLVEKDYEDKDYPFKTSTVVYSPPVGLYSYDDPSYDWFTFGMMVYDLFFGLPKVNESIVLNKKIYKQDYLLPLYQKKHNSFNKAYQIFKFCTSDEEHASSQDIYNILVGLRSEVQ